MAAPLGRWLSRRVVAIPPPVFLALLNLSFGLIGWGLLMLPAAQAVPFGWGDALFTSMASITVVGFGVIGVADHLSLFGQVVVLGLIQLGGLGLMTFAVLVLSAFGLPIGLTQSAILREDLNQTSIGRLLDLVAVILRVMLACELAGTVALAFVFVPEFGPWPGLWHAFFHAVSAFNNAGISTLPTSLVPYVANPVVNLVVPILIIIGGLGYGVLTEVARVRRWHRFSLHAKMMLVGTAVLVVGSVTLTALLEWHNPGTLGALDPGAKLMASWFQGVTTRTAGFNTVDINALEDSTTTLFIALMVIGAGPTSTGGGIKVTTLFVMLIATHAFFRRQTELHAFGRSIGTEETLKVMALTAIGLIVVFSGVFLLTLAHEGEFLDIAFNIASAFGTTGLARGDIASLDGFGRTVLMTVGFIGRVGPLTLGYFLATQSVPRVRYPEAQVYLG